MHKHKQNKKIQTRITNQNIVSPANKTKTKNQHKRIKLKTRVYLQTKNQQINAETNPTNNARQTKKCKMDTWQDQDQQRYQKRCKTSMVPKNTSHALMLKTK